MAYYGHTPRDMSTILTGEQYYIKERRAGWGQWRRDQKILAVAVREAPNASPTAWFFRTLDGTKVQRSADGVWGLKSHVDECDEKERVAASARALNTEAFTAQIQPWIDRLESSDRWREVLKVSMSSYIQTDWSTGVVSGKPEDHPITIQTTTAGLKRLCLALLGDELNTVFERQT